MTISESVIRKTFQRNLVRLFAEKNKMKKDLADYVGVSANTVTSWCAGQKVPRMDKLDMICNFFHVERSELLQAHDSSQTGYYTDPETAEIANALKEGDGMLRVLFDAARDLPPDKMKEAATYIQYLKAQQHPEEE